MRNFKLILRPRLVIQLCNQVLSVLEGVSQPGLPISFAMKIQFWKPKFAVGRNHFKSCGFPTVCYYKIGWNCYIPEGKNSAEFIILIKHTLWSFLFYYVIVSWGIGHWSENNVMYHSYFTLAFECLRVKIVLSSFFSRIVAI